MQQRFYYRSYCLLNMFRATLCPSSGAQDYYTVVAACGISCCGFQVFGLLRSWGLCVRFAGCCSILQTGHITSFWIDYILITDLMHWLLFIHKILFSSTCFVPQVLVFRRIHLYTCSIWYCHSLWEFLVTCRYTAWVRTDCRGRLLVGVSELITFWVLP